MVRLRSSARYAAVKSLIATFAASYRPLPCARSASTLATRPSDHKNGRNTGTSRKYTTQAGNPQSNRGTTPTKKSAPARPVNNVAVLGGGITGLSSAWYLAQAFPKAHITVYESGDRFGGWLESNTVDVGGDKVLFEAGPRSLRPQGIPGFVMLNLVDELGMYEEIVRPNKLSKDRYVYYPDHLARMPTQNAKLFWNIRNILSEPVFDGLLRGLIAEYSQPPRSPQLKDESVGSLVGRRLGKNIANNMVSAVFHGIYAGDIWKLSAKSLLNAAWNIENKYGSFTRSFLNRMGTHQHSMPALDWVALTEMRSRMEERGTSNMNYIQSDNTLISTLTFTKGVQMLSDRLGQKLKAKPNVTLKSSSPVTGITMDPKKGSFEVVDPSGPATFDHIISTLSPKTLRNTLSIAQLQDRQATSLSTALQSLQESEKPVTVGVVNVYYRRTVGNRPQGFGYLIPQSVPFEQNPERALGVVFDSDVFAFDLGKGSIWSPPIGELNKMSTFFPERINEGDIFTVMIGGHWWDGWSLPDEDELKDLALSVLERHLDITQAPDAFKVTLQRDCIPQYTVGHHERLAGLHDALVDCFDGRLRVAGSPYTGVSVNDCIIAGWRNAENLKASSEGILEPTRRTGLEKFKYGSPDIALSGRGSSLALIDADEVAALPQWFQGSNGAFRALKNVD